MNNKQFISNLSATYADIRKLDVKKINLKGKNILEYIEGNKTIILDERGTLANDELDVWNSYITKDENGNVIIDRNAKPKEHRSIERNNDANSFAVYEGITESQANVIKTAVKVIDNEVLGANDEHIMYWQTDGLISGFWMFYYCDNLTTFSSDLSSLTDGKEMFNYCSNINSFNGDLSRLEDGRSMFQGCSNLTTFTSDLSSLTNGDNMFYMCENLTSFSSDLSSLTSGGGMFYCCKNLTSFNIDLPRLTGAYGMFQECGALTSFSSELPRLTNAENMFYNCVNLTSFSSDLSSLMYAESMFDLCRLDAQSVANIITFLPTNESQETITIGIGIPNTDEAKQAFAEECYCDSWEELNQDFSAKNWEVQWQFNGSASYSLRDPRPSTAVFARLEEVIMPTEEEIAAA